MFKFLAAVVLAIAVIALEAALTAPGGDVVSIFPMFVLVMAAAVRFGVLSSIPRTGRARIVTGNGH